MSKTKHGHYTNKRASLILQSYASMKQRCLNPNHLAYKDYGGRGIIICDKWLGENGFMNFVEDMGDRPKGTELDRKDNNGNYEPSNCRWITIKENSRNRRSTKLTLKDAIEIRKIYNPEKITMQEIANAYGVARTTISSLIHNRSWT